jgi:hypothetical protein
MTHRPLRVVGVFAAVLTALCVPAFSQTAPAGASPSTDEGTFRIIVLETADEARRVREELARGGNFVALAAARSVDPSAANGGMVGRVPLSALRPEFRNAVGGLAIGELSPVVPVVDDFDGDGRFDVVASTRGNLNSPMLHCGITRSPGPTIRRKV